MPVEVTQASWSPQEARTQGKGSGGTENEDDTLLESFFLSGFGVATWAWAVWLRSLLFPLAGHFGIHPVFQQNPQCVFSVPCEQNQEAAVGMGSWQPSSRSTIFPWAFVMYPKTQNLSLLSFSPK